MNFFDKIGRFFGISDDYEEKEIGKETEPVKESSAETKEPPKNEYAANNVVNFSSAASNKENTSAYPIKLVKSEIRTIKPKKFEDARIISNFLRDKIAIVINFEETDPAIANKIIDFVSGTAYAIRGRVRPIGQKVFIGTPENVKIESYEDENKSKGPFID